MVICFATDVPKTTWKVFDGAFAQYATLIVPEEAIDDYRFFWNYFGEFKTIESVPELVAIMPCTTDSTRLLISQDAGIVTISGMENGNIISVYNLDGKRVVSAEATGTSTTCDLTKLQGTIAVIRVGDKSAKVMIR